MTERDDSWIPPENWQARIGAAIRMLDEALETGRIEPARRAHEIANQLIAEEVILEAKRNL
jgi:hypothetical protein